MTLVKESPSMRFSGTHFSTRYHSFTDWTYGDSCLNSVHPSIHLDRVRLMDINIWLCTVSLTLWTIGSLITEVELQTKTEKFSIAAESYSKEEFRCKIEIHVLKREIFDVEHSFRDMLAQTTVHMSKWSSNFVHSLERI